MNRKHQFVFAVGILSTIVAGSLIMARKSRDSVIFAKHGAKRSIARLEEGALPGLYPKKAFKKLKLVQPTAILQEPGDNSKFYVLEKAGKISVFDNRDDVETARTFADLTSQVVSGDVESVTYEEGLLNMAFHPKWALGKKQVFIYYNRGTDPNNLFVRLSRFESRDGGKTLDPASETPLLDIKKDRGNHNGGGLVFDADGFLFVGIGDGGLPNDPKNRGQDKNAFLGKVLRLDVDKASNGKNYGIPAGNPFASGGGLPEIFSYGHRNPWRIAIDPVKGTIYEAEVGQELIEEVNVLERGRNYGWSAKEGTRILKADAKSRAEAAGEKLVDPVAEYQHNEGLSVTGGLVYRGNDPKLVGLKGLYVFGDFSTGLVWALKPKAAPGQFDRILVGQTGRAMSSFGEDQEGNLFIADHNSGSLFRLEGGDPITPPDPNLPVHFFLGRDGAGTEESGFKYYDSIGARRDLTLDEWIKENIGEDSNAYIETLYQNVGDLGFWRDMKCSKVLGRGKGGCAVKNWKNPDDKEKFFAAVKAGQKPTVQDLGTVTMNVSPEGFTRFYVFAPGGKLSPAAILDFEGPKFAPQLCTPCHSGKYTGGSPDMGALFREFEPTWLGKHPSKTQEQAEKEWFQMNQAIKTANASLTSDNPEDLERFKKLNEYVDSMYEKSDPAAPKATRPDDPSHLPPSWSRPEKNPLLAKAKVKLWQELVAPYCMQCHRTNSEDFSSYEAWEKVGLESGGVSDLERYVGFPAEEKEFNAEEKKLIGQGKLNVAKAEKLIRRQKQFMPNAFVTREFLIKDEGAKQAMKEWLVQAESPDVPTARVTFEVVTRDNLTSLGEEIYVVGSLRQLGLQGTEEKDGLGKNANEKWLITNGIKLSAKPLGGGKLLWTGSTKLPVGAQYRWKTFIMSKVAELTRWQCDVPALTINGAPQKDSAGQPIMDLFEKTFPGVNPASVTPDKAFWTVKRVENPRYETQFHVNGAQGNFGCGP